MRGETRADYQISQRWRLILTSVFRVTVYITLVASAALVALWEWRKVPQSFELNPDSKHSPQNIINVMIC